MEKYVLATGDIGADRLRMLERLYGPATDRLLTDLDIEPGMRVADIGCGVGSVVLWLADRVAPDGIAIGVDISPEQLAVAARSAGQLGIMNIDLREGSAYDTGLPPASLDLVFSRSVLSHLEDPAAVVRHYASLVRPGGLVVCEDIDMDTIHTVPPSPAMDRVIDLYFALAVTTKCDYRVGARLPTLLADAGLSDIGTRQDQPCPTSGDDKRWWEYTFAESAPAMFAAGVLDAEEYARLMAELAAIGTDDTTAICQPTHFQAWGRVPARAAGRSLETWPAWTHPTEWHEQRRRGQAIDHRVRRSIGHRRIPIARDW